MALPKFYKVCQDQNGNIVPQVLGSVYNQGTGVLASLYQDDAGTIPLANPMTSDAQYGSFKFYVNPGHYDLTFTKPGYTFEPIMDFQVPEDTVTLGTMAQQDAHAVAITGGSATGLTSVGIGGAAGYPLQNAGQSYLIGAIGVGVAPQAAFAITTASVPCAFSGPLSLQHPGGTPRWTLDCDGNMGLPGGAAAIVNSTSSQTLKRDIADLTGALATLLRLRGRTWRWTEDRLETLLPGPQAGFVVEEVAQVRPQWTTVADDGTRGLVERGFSAYVVEALREIVARLEALEAR